MPFEKVESSVDFPALERSILKFWDENGIFAKRKAINAGKPKWSFLDGPITANNPMGVHHAWGRTYKDVYNRYFAMTGHDLRYQQGFDCQGLWVEVEVEKELKLKSKRDIESLVPGDKEASIDRFVQACKDRVNKFARVQTDQSIRLGYWMNWDRTDADWAKKPDDRHSYFTMSEVNNYTIWSFLKKCHHKGLINRGYDVMPWCGRCGVGISEQEMKEGYKLVEHRACFVKFPLKDREKENLLVWTTTPWTLTSNVGAAINPDLPYLKVKVKDEVYYVAKGAFKLNRMEGSGGGEADADEGEAGSKGKRPWLKEVPNLVTIEQHFKVKAGKGETYEVVGEVKGADLMGLEYVGPFDDLPAQNYEYGFPEDVAKVTKQSGHWPAKTAAQSHKVVSGGKDVTETEGTGIVHTAPGCGAIDYQWGKQNGLPPVAPIGDDGIFVEGFGPLVGKNAVDPATADAVFEQLKSKDRLFAVERYVHRYPHCWRCKTELLYRLVDEWFINMGPKGESYTVTERGDDGKERQVSKKRFHGGFRADIAAVVEQVKFLPEMINGQVRELDWLANMGDWMISKKRYWGLALPVWVNDNDPTDFEVIGSYEELKARAVEGWAEFEGHTPHRPWIDKVKIESTKHPGQRMSRVPDVGNPWLDAGIVAFSTMPKEWYPADFITESFPGQFRNWFYALLAMSTMMSDGKPPFKTLLGHGLVRDQFGHEMHKTAGNSIEFRSAADEGGQIVNPKGGTLPFSAIGADVMRWLYCRQNPALNLNFGPEPANDVRSRVFFKLWNTYAMFCNYAIGDGFDPAAPAVPVSQRPDIDRWLLSNLQSLITTAHKAYSEYDVMTFALKAEEFIEGDLSNWYVRRNKDRLHSKNADLDAAGLKDKQAAYQTLYTTLTTLCKLLAPSVPFITEVMWQNLRLPTDPESVHLCDLPKADAALVDAPLSEDMAAVQRVISLGLAARQQAKLNVRQPLAELVVSTDSDVEKRATERFRDLILDELNVKAVRLHDAGAGPLLVGSAKLNQKVAGSKLGANLKAAQAELAAMDSAKLASDLGKGPVTVAGVALVAADFNIEHAGQPGWAGVADRGVQVAVSTTVTEALKLEGLARDVIRQVQNARKDAKLDLLDKIELHLSTSTPELTKAIAEHGPNIATAVQATQWSAEPLSGVGVHTATAKIDGQPLTIALRKV
ncbi:class I tRNA ligase family protein [Gemmata sp. JC673]|uniref:isoleucine--tRNA ligase n=1 Tax=Gemmata algarum TaxID=2975278 RepID=A0ABU5F0N9_9BACT|nr:class I tRNA ligase family protein [Gemmata algarum]MDY3559663.1 class I tRNA ligase family protein [Gemmata algarum]